MVWKFRRLEECDFDLLHQWMNHGEVKKWYTKGTISFVRIQEKYGPCVTGESPKLTMIACLDGCPTGFLQAYSLGNYPAYAAQVGICDAVGIDLFIGEANKLNHGLGSAMLRVFVEKKLPCEFTESIAVIGPEPDNKRAIRAYEKAGFQYFHQIENPREEMFEYLMKRPLPKCNEIPVDSHKEIEI